MLNTSSVKLYSLEYKEVRTYLIALLFIVGNVLLPQLCHLVPGGGPRWLPIYFFTLIGAYKYGWRVGLLTAIASPLANSFLFGMPQAVMLPSILLKSVVLSGIAAYAARRFRSASLVLLLGVVAGYQLIGALGEFLMALCSDISIVSALTMAVQDFRIGFPGIAVQVLVGYIVINRILRR